MWGSIIDSIIAVEFRHALIVYSFFLNHFED